MHNWKNWISIGNVSEMCLLMYSVLSLLYWKQPLSASLLSQTIRLIDSPWQAAKQVPRFQESRAKNVASATVQVFPVFQEKIDFMWFITFTP